MTEDSVRVRATEAKPVVKWAGGKRKHAPLIVSSMGELDPEMDYCEPFAGGLATFFYLRSTGYVGHAQLSDTCAPLIAMYVRLRDDCKGLSDELLALRDAYLGAEDPRAFYLEKRALYNALDPEDPQRSSLFILLNKLGFNGLYRTNKKGGFNIPWCKDPSRDPFPEKAQENLALASKALQNTTLLALPFREAVLTWSIRRGSGWVYFDPPYTKVKKTTFVSYDGSKGFGEIDHVSLHHLASYLAASGFRVALSDHDLPIVRSRWVPSLDIGLFELTEVRERRSCNSKGEGRGRVPCVLFVGGPCE